jgi:hypothetical protein
MSVRGAIEINMECVMYFNSIRSESILDLYLDFYFTYKCKYKESLSSLLRIRGHQRQLETWDNLCITGLSCKLSHASNCVDALVFLKK